MDQKQITFSRLGRYGRLGNQLFQIAAAYALAKTNSMGYLFPKWEHQQYFKGKLPVGHLPTATTIKEREDFRHEDLSGRMISQSTFDLLGYFQSVKYFGHYANDIRAMFDFEEEVKDCVQDLYGKVLGKNNTTCINVRRTDYVNNPAYAQIGMHYYNQAMKLMPKGSHYIVVSDDITWCKENFKGKQFTFIEGRPDYEQIYIMTQCEHHIIANSTFGWWGAWLSTRAAKGQHRVTCPKEWFGPDNANLDARDIVPEGWTKIAATPKTDLSDVTFLIPVRIEHPDRLENLKLCISFLTKYFETNISIGEYSASPKVVEAFLGYENDSVMVYDFRCKPGDVFNTSWVINELATHATTKFIMQYDADVFFDPKQIIEAVAKLREGFEMVYPHDGTYYGADRSKYYKRMLNVIDFGVFRKNHYPKAKPCVGGAVAFERLSFLAAGGENESIIGYGPNDVERAWRFELLRFKIYKVPGPLLHMNHEIIVADREQNPYFKSNWREFERIKKLSYKQLLEELKTWQHDVQPLLTALEDTRIDLTDVTFLVAYKPDSTDRRENFHLQIEWLEKNFITNIRVGMEPNGISETGQSTQFIKTQFIDSDPIFHHTKYLNELAKRAETPIICLHDIDVFARPSQILAAVQEIRNGISDVVYPFDGRFLRCDRLKYFKRFSETLDIGIFNGQPFSKADMNGNSCGGSVFISSNIFFESGGENENIIGWGPYDLEKKTRFEKLGYKVSCVKGPLFHMEHDLTNSGTNEKGNRGHNHLDENFAELAKIQAFDKRTLREYVNTWPQTIVPVEAIQFDVADYLFGDKIFIETGTCNGATVQKALDAGYAEIRSVEYDDTLFNNVLKRYQDNTRVNLYWGKSTDRLREMIEGLTSPAVFWLDAHPSDPHTGGYQDLKEKGIESDFHEHNILPAELDLIFESECNEHIIFIDDQYGVTEENLRYRAMLSVLNPDYQFLFMDDAGKKDKVLACIPSKYMHLIGSAASKGNLLNSYVDNVYLLNLESRPDRKEKAIERLKDNGFKKVTLFKAVDGKAEKLGHKDPALTPGMLGCFQSHIKILRHAIQNGFSRILILEDDFVPVDGFQRMLELALPLIPADWQFAYLGYHEDSGFGKFKERVNEYWVYPNAVWGTHAYMVNGLETMKILLDMLSTQRLQLDRQLTHEVYPSGKLNFYCVYPAIINQDYNGLGTDIQIRDK